MQLEKYLNPVATGHKLTPAELCCVYNARTTTDIINVAEPAYNGRTVTDSNALKYQ